MIARQRPWMDPSPSEWYTTWTARKSLSTENRSTVPATDILSHCYHPLVKHARYYWLLRAEGHLNRAAIRGDAGLARAVAGSDGIERRDPVRSAAELSPSSWGQEAK